MKLYDDTPLPNGNAITARTYYKPTSIMNVPLLNVTVSSIANIASGTVTARIGDTDSYTEIDKTELYQYINFGGYSLTS